MAEGTSGMKLSSIRRIRRVTEREKECAKIAWKEVEKDYSTYGRNVFIRLFEQHPEIKNYFLGMLGKNEDLFSSPKFQEHMLQILIPTLSGLILNWDSSEGILEAIRLLAIYHKKNVTTLREDHVLMLAQVILFVLKRDLGSSYTEDQEKAVEKIILIIFEEFNNFLLGRSW
ncbi:hypothetical protein J6590_010733 [Homalodisca vitripennis]|nr:hypothetical protein J6590_010733 [Homalodisca vitripennis]